MAKKHRLYDTEPLGFTLFGGLTDGLFPQCFLCNDLLQYKIPYIQELEVTICISRIYNDCAYILSACYISF